MNTYSYKYIYHNYTTFVKDGKPITYGTVVLARKDGTPLIAKIRNKDYDEWSEIQDYKMDYGSVNVRTSYDKFGKVVPESFDTSTSDSSSALDENGLPI